MSNTKPKENNSLQDIDLLSLVLYEKACRVLSTHYDILVKKYDGSLDYDTNSFNSFNKINAKRGEILEELERRITNL